MLMACEEKLRGFRASKEKRGEGKMRGALDVIFIVYIYVYLFADKKDDKSNSNPYIYTHVKGQGTGRLQDHLCPATPATGLELTYSCERDKGALQLQFNFTW